MSSALQIIAGTTGSFNSNRDHSRLGPVDDALAIERAADDARVARAEWWLINDCPDAGDDRLASAVEAAAVLRDSYRLSSSLAEAQLNDIWNRVACEPPLTPAQIAEAVRQAYCFRRAVIGARETAEYLEPLADVDPSPVTHDTPAELAPQAEPVDVVAQSHPVITTTPKPVDTTECALCASRRKAKRERTRRWRALRARPAMKREVANV